MRYGALYVDPPWGFKNFSAKGEKKNPNQHYPCMTVDEIAALPVGELAAKDCALFMWTTGPFLEHSFKVAGAWGFTYSTTGFTWAKQNPSGDGWAFGTGYWTRANPEYCLLFKKGSPARLATDVPELVVAPRTKHSEKPAEVRARIQRLVAGPYCEVFARQQHPGWTCLGNEIDGMDLASAIRAQMEQPALFAPSPPSDGEEAKG